MLGSGKGWGGLLKKSPRRDGIYQAASVVQQRTHEKITLSLLCDWEVNESHELSVHVISDFGSKVHGRGWIVIFLLISLWRYWGYTDLIKVWSSPSSLFSGKGCVRLVLFLPWMFVKLFGPKVFFGQCVLNT